MANIPSRQEIMQRRFRLTVIGLVSAAACLGLGYAMGQPTTKPYLPDVLLLALIVGFVLFALVGTYIFLRRIKPEDKPKAIISLVAIALFLIAVLFIGRWIALAELHQS